MPRFDFTRRAVLATAVVALPMLALTSSPALAKKPATFTESSGLAIKGYDSVAYFTESKPVRGSAEHATEWKGATWRFASAENLEKFKADPAAYAPQYGGYCAYAVSRNYTAKSEPEAWTIVNGKLYMNYDINVRDNFWAPDIPANIAKADKNVAGLIEQ